VSAGDECARKRCRLVKVDNSWYLGSWCCEDLAAGCGQGAASIGHSRRVVKRGLRWKRPARTTKGTLVQLNQQRVRKTVVPNLRAALEAAAMAMGLRWIDDGTMRSVGGFERGWNDSEAVRRRKECATVAATNQQLVTRLGACCTVHACLRMSDSWTQ